MLRGLGKDELAGALGTLLSREYLWKTVSRETSQNKGSARTEKGGTQVA